MMTKTIQAIYLNGVFRPVLPLFLSFSGRHGVCMDGGRHTAPAPQPAELDLV